MSTGCPHRRGPRVRPPARIIGMSAGCPHRRALLTLCMGYRHRRALLTPARVISPSRCRQPPHDVNDPLTMSTMRVRADFPLTMSTTRVRAGGAPAPGPGPTSAPPGCAPSPGGTHTRTPIYATRAAHKGVIPPLCAAPCFLIPSLVCDTGKGRGAGDERAGRPRSAAAAMERIMGSPTAGAADPRHPGGAGRSGPDASARRPRHWRRAGSIAVERTVARVWRME